MKCMFGYTFKGVKIDSICYTSKSNFDPNYPTTWIDKNHFKDNVSKHKSITFKSLLTKIKINFIKINFDHRRSKYTLNWWLWHVWFVKCIIDFTLKVFEVRNCSFKFYNWILRFNLLFNSLLYKSIVTCMSLPQTQFLP
jgi:hypothetical protein